LIIDKSIYLVNPNFAKKLHELKGCEIVFICDDSGSMSATIGELSFHLHSCFSPMYLLFGVSGESTNPSENQLTRCKILLWCGNDDSLSVLSSFAGDELKQTVSIVVDLASVLDPDGVDVYFLNREPMFHVRNSSELENLFAMAPEGT